MNDLPKHCASVSFAGQIFHIPIYLYFAGIYR